MDNEWSGPILKCQMYSVKTLVRSWVQWVNCDSFGDHGICLWTKLKKLFILCTSGGTSACGWKHTYLEFSPFSYIRDSHWLRGRKLTRFTDAIILALIWSPGALQEHMLKHFVEIFMKPVSLYEPVMAGHSFPIEESAIIESRKYLRFIHFILCLYGSHQYIK
jgi:hypothetical protein